MGVLVSERAEMKIGIRGAKLGRTGLTPLVPEDIPLETAIITTAVLSRRYGYAELVDMEPGQSGLSSPIIAVFLFGHQLALNRAWRDEFDPAFGATGPALAPEAQKELT